MEFTLTTLTFLVLCQTWEGLSCPVFCKCCVNDICGIGVEGRGKGWTDVCLEGCKDGYYQPRCMWSCPGNCRTCEQDNGICISCKPGFFGTGNNCSNVCPNNNCACTVTQCDFCVDGFYNTRQFCNLLCPNRCREGKCNDDGTCSCIANFEGDKCDVCVQGKYGELCNVSCSNGCREGKCNNDGTCSCITNFEGDKCDICVQGKYGKLCNASCSNGCREGKCNDNGTCSCITNFEGDICDVCVQGKYGELCSSDCNNENCRCTKATNCIYCKQGFYDFSTFCTKSCSNGCLDVCENNGSCACLPQYSGGTCGNCKHGYYGDKCTIPCSKGCINGSCKRDGTCQCIQYFSGTKCETCNAGHYSDACTKECGRGCTNGTCERNDGRCECEHNFEGSLCNLCKEGYFGSNCNLSCSDNCSNCSSFKNCFACKEGYLGLDCSHQCSASCLESRCEIDDGFCTEGCVDGFTAATCSGKCDGICKTCSQANSTHCTSCFGGFRGPACKCIPNCQCELNSDVCNECTHGFEMKSKDCKCNRNYCLNSFQCTSCQNDTFYTYHGTCCECNTHCKHKQCSSEAHCLNGCEDGYTGEDCADLCADYDTNCRKCSQIEHFCVNCESGFSPDTESVCARQCSDTCVNKECDAKTGRCLQGCDEQYWGHNCNHSCHPSCTSFLQENGTCTQCVNKSLISVGNYCTRQCSETCVNQMCDAKTGRCLQGCIHNFYADKCDLICPSTCASEPNKTRCDNYGRCLHGCMECYKGVTCANASPTPKSDSLVGGLIGGTVGGASTIVSVVIVIVVFLYLKRRKRHKNPPESESQRVFRNPNPFTIEDQEMHYQQLSDRHNTTAGVQDEAYTELQTNNMDYELLDI